VAVDLIKKGRGKHFAPDITDAFMSIDLHFKAIAEMHSNDEEM
jgi:hypothetical protein